MVKTHTNIYTHLIQGDPKKQNPYIFVEVIWVLFFWSQPVCIYIYIYIYIYKMVINRKKVTDEQIGPINLQS